MRTVYVDRGWAWGTVVGGFVANFLLGGLAKSYGLITEAFQEVFHSGSAYLLLAGGLIYTLMYCLSLVNHYVSGRYGSRPVVIVGALGSCLSLMVATFSPNIALWVVAVGVGVGASFSCIYFTIFSMVGRCFRRYLGIANGVSVSGVSVGQMAFPALITYLNRTYGPRGGTLVIAGFCLHLLITAVLMPRHIIDPDAEPVPKKSPATSSKTKSRNFRRLPWKKRKRTDITSITERQEAFEADDVEPLPSSNGYSGKVLAASTSDEPSCELIKKLGSMDSINVRLNKRLTLSLLVLYIVAKVFGDIGDVSVTFVAPLLGTEYGFDPVIVSRAITVSGAVDLVARLGIGWLTDRPICTGRRGRLLAFTWIIEGMNAFCFAELNRLSASWSADRVDFGGTSVVGPGLSSVGLTVGYFVCFGIHGVCSGTAMTQMVVVLCDWVGSEQLAHSLAVTMVILGLLISPGQFLIGKLADYLGSYVWPMRICCVILLIAGLLLLLEIPVRWFYGLRSRATCLLNRRTNPCDTSTPTNGPGSPGGVNLVIHCDTPTTPQPAWSQQNASSMFIADNGEEAMDELAEPPLDVIIVPPGLGVPMSSISSVNSLELPTNENQVI